MELRHPGGADAQYREDVLVLAAVGVAVLTAFLMLALWLGGASSLKRIGRSSTSARMMMYWEWRRHTNWGRGWASESDDDEPREVVLTLCHPHSGGL